MPNESPKLDLNSIHANGADISRGPDEKTKEELDAMDSESKRLDLEGKRQDIAARREYANKIFLLISRWLAAMIGVVLLSGFGSDDNWFKLGDSVLIALITTTTASVVGLFVIVANYLFKRK